jgi:hypothetical protein
LLVTVASEAATVDASNEDFVAATTHEVVLIDGLSTAGVDSGCIHGTSWFARQLGGSLMHSITESHGRSLVTVLADAIDLVAQSHANTCDLSHPGTPAGTVVLLRERAQQIEYLVLADSTAAFVRHDGMTVICDRREAAASQAHRADLDATLNGTPEHEYALRQFMRDMQAIRNQPGGFWVAAGDPAVAEQAITGALSLSGMTVAAALSDGATRLVDLFQLTDWPNLMETLALNGPAGLIQQTREAEHSDPTGRRWRRGKTTDDASIAYCAITR